MANIINMKAICVELGERFRSERKKQGLTQAKLSASAGIDRSYLINIEHGRSNITLDVIFRLCGALDMSVSDLFKGINPTQ